MDVITRRVVTPVHKAVCIAIYVPNHVLPQLKELAMAADRQSTDPNVKELAWDIFQALDKLPREDMS